VEAIVAAAVELADAGGLEAVSMERVAQHFGYTPMALYRYVPGKPELLELMIDQAVGRAPVPSGPPAQWRLRLAAWARNLWAGFHRRPWLLAATGQLRVMGPNELSWLETGMEVLGATGLSVRERQAACLTVVTQVRGLAQFSVQRLTSGGGLTPAGWEKATRKLLERREGEYPQLAQLLAPAQEAASIDVLRFGLSCVLEGIEQLIAARQRR
jgi:AcrR family transcriptional regulator